MSAQPDAAAAAVNNAAWCAAVWRSHGLAAREAQGLWMCDQQTPPFYPNVVTVTPGPTAGQTALIAALLQADPTLDLSVKDSFATLDLRALGMRVLFDAGWCGRKPQATSGARPSLRLHRVVDADGLAEWERAWRSVGEAAAPVFPPPLLADPRVMVLSVIGDDGSMPTGGIAFEAGGVVGLTNLFGDVAAFLDAFAWFAPETPLVFYAPDDTGRLAEARGFRSLGPLRIWVRDGVAAVAR